MNQVSAELAECDLKTIEDQTINFSTIYQRQTTLIFFVRHFGCLFCRERVASLAEALPLLTTHHLNAVVIGNGHPYMAEGFVEELQLPLSVYCDRKGEAYRLAGMQRNFGLNVTSVKHAWRSYRAGNRQHKVSGDVWQQGGVLAVNPAGQVLEAIADQSAGDYIDIPKLVERVVLSGLT